MVIFSRKHSRSPRAFECGRAFVDKYHPPPAPSAESSRFLHPQFVGLVGRGCFVAIMPGANIRVQVVCLQILCDLFLRLHETPPRLFNRIFNVG